MNSLLLFALFIGITTLVSVIIPIGILVPRNKTKKVTFEKTTVHEQVSINADFGKDLRQVDINDL